MAIRNIAEQPLKCLWIQCLFFQTAHVAQLIRRKDNLSVLQTTSHSSMATAATDMSSDVQLRAIHPPKLDPPNNTLV